MHLFKQFHAIVIEAVQSLIDSEALPAGLLLSAITVDPPREAAHGDLATNAAMVLAKPAGKNPREIAGLVAAKLEAHPQIVKTEIAGPGFINLTLAPEIWEQVITDVLAEGTAYGDSGVGGGEKLNVEFVSTNPTGPVHIGHARGGVYGDVLARLLTKAGFAVTKEYYVNDAGAQVDKLARSAYLRYRELFGESIIIPEGHYPGDYLVPVAQALKDKHGDALLKQPEAEWLPVVKQAAVAAMMELIRADLGLLGITYDVFTSEAEVVRKHQDASFTLLEGKGLIYQGVLEPPKGKMPEDWEPREQTLLRATQFGDDVDRPLKKSDGSWAYLAGDVAYHYDKLLRGFRQMILVLGMDHGGYQKRLSAVVSALSDGKAKIDIQLYGLVKFLKNGEPVKMSKRSGTFLEVGDVVEAVGKDVARFFMLTRKNSETIDFDFVKVTEQSKDNPVFYVQYAHARAHSVLRNAKVEGFAPGADVSGLNHPAEIALIKKLAEWPRMVELAAQAHEPHRIAYYLHETAAQFHGLWAQLKFIVPEDQRLTQARLALVRAVAIVIASGLHVFGVAPVESM